MGMVEDVTIRFITTGTASLRAVSNTLRTMSSQLTTLQSKLQSLGSGLSRVGQTATIGLTVPLVAGFTKSIMLASDFNEAINVVDVTFKKNANNIKNWSKNLNESFGLGQFQAVKFAGTMGSILKTVGFGSDAVLGMSKQIVELTGDLASFKNLGIDESFNKIRAGLLGEVEPLRQVGILMDENTTKAYALANGLDKKYSSLSQAEKVMWRYKSLLAQTADASGDFLRTGDSFANMMKKVQNKLQDLSLIIGNALLPHALKLLGYADRIISAFMKLNPETQKTIFKIVGITAVIPPLLMLLGTLATIISAVVGVLGLLAGALTVVISPLAFFIGAILGAGIVAGIFHMNSQEVSQDLTDMQQKFVKIAKVVMTVVNVFKILINTIQFVVKTAINILTILSTAFVGLVAIIAKSLEIAGQAIEETFSKMGDMIYNIFEGIKYVILKAISEIVNGVIDKVNMMAGALNYLPFVDIGSIANVDIAPKAPEFKLIDKAFTKTTWKVAELKGVISETFDSLGKSVENTGHDIYEHLQNIGKAMSDIEDIRKDDDYGMSVWNAVTGIIGGGEKKDGKTQKPTNFVPTSDDIVKKLGDIADAGKKAGKSLGDTGSGLKDTFDKVGESIDNAVKKLFDLDKAFFKITFERFSPGKILRRTRQALKYTTETITGINQLQDMGVNQNIIKYLQDKGVEGLGIVRGLLGADTGTRQAILGNIGLTQGVASAGVAGWQKREIHVSGGLEVKMGNETIKLSKEAVENIVASVISENATRYL